MLLQAYHRIDKGATDAAAERLTSWPWGNSGDGEDGRNGDLQLASGGEARRRLKNLLDDQNEAKYES